VPRALFTAVILVGIVYVISGYAASIGFGQSHVDALSSDQNPLTTLSDRYWGKDLAWLLTLTVLNSQFANALSGSNAAVRIIFSLGREGILSRRIGVTNRSDSPVAAWTAYILFSAVLSFALGSAIGPLGVYSFLGSALGLGIIVLYISMNIGLVRYFWTRHRHEFSVIRHGVLPVIGSILLLLPIYGQLWPIPDWPYNLVPYILVAWTLVGCGYFLYLRKTKPAVVEGMGRVWEPDPTDGSDVSEASGARSES
jgi:amino acid transporter